MIERVIENWLDRAGERSFEAAFCYMLSAEGYTVLHLTRHSPMEMGKDIIAIAPDGVPCVFQLKSARGGELTLSQYRSDVEKQLPSLVEFPPEHPSLPVFLSHRAFLVTNGTLAEETIAAIRLQNESYARRGLVNRLGTLVKGQLYDKAIALSDSLLPRELSEFREFFTLVLELYMSEGREPLPKQKLCELLEKIFVAAPETKTHSKPEVLRRISAGSLLIAILTNEYSQKQNYFAEIEAWSICIALSIQFGVENGVSDAELRREVQIGRDLILDRSIRLVHEASASSNLVEGNPLMDKLVLPVRVTYLLGVASMLPLLSYEGDTSLIDLIIENHANRSMSFWGEAAVPYYLPLLWYLEKADPAKANTILIDLIKILCVRNAPYSVDAVPNPYYSAAEILRWSADLDDVPDDEFSGKSFTLFPLMCLAFNRGLKEELKELWPFISKILVRQVEVKGAERFSWRARNSIDRVSPLPVEGKWDELAEWSNITVVDDLPSLVRDDPVLLLLTCQVFPHRLTRGVTTFLDERWREIRIANR